MTAIRVKSDMAIPADILAIKDIFKSNGYSLFVVGGAVRDFIKQQPIKDYDIATDAIPDKVEEMMRGAGYTTIATGKQFGVINVLTEENEYEIATFREDIGSSDSRRPDEVIFSDIETDVKRRDLTINALFYDIDAGEIVDLVGGIEDLENEVIRTVGSANDRFQEDRLRILRAIRFAARYHAKLDMGIIESISGDNSLELVSPERIRDEFIKGVKTARDTRYLDVFYRTFKLYDYIFPSLTLESSDFNENDYILLMSYMLRENSTDLLGKVLNKLTYSREEIKAIKFLVSFQELTPENAPTFKKRQSDSHLTNEQIKTFADMVFMDSELIKAFLKFELTISGDEVMDKYQVKGADIGAKILELEIELFNELI